MSFSSGLINSVVPSKLMIFIRSISAQLSIRVVYRFWVHHSFGAQYKVCQKIKNKFHKWHFVIRMQNWPKIVLLSTKNWARYESLASNRSTLDKFREKNFVNISSNISYRNNIKATPAQNKFLKYPLFILPVLILCLIKIDIKI